MIEYQAGDYVCIRGEDGFIKDEWIITSDVSGYLMLTNTTRIDVLLITNEELNKNYEYAGTKTRYNRFTQQEKDLYLPI